MKSLFDFAMNDLKADPFIHPLAFVDDTASIGRRTRVWQFASVIRGTVLGEDCNVASTATLDGPRFGDRCIVSSGVAIGPGFVVGDDVFIGPNVVLCNDNWPAVSKQGFKAEAFTASYAPFITIRIGDGAAIGANATILPGRTIGARAMVAAGAVVTKDVPADYLFTRSGDLVRIKPEWRANRMKRVAE